jgi:hypothetical protein
MPEGIADVQVSATSQEHTAVPWEPESTYNPYMQPEDGLDLLGLEDEDRLSDDIEDNPDWEVPDSNWMEFENAEPQAAQSGVTYPAPSN